MVSLNFKVLLLPISTVADLQGSTAVNSRTKAVRALGLVGDREAVPVLQAALRDPEYARIQRVVRQALDALGSPSPLP